MLYLLLVSVLPVNATKTSVDIPRSLLGREYVIAARVERISKPVELGKMKIYAGLRVYNPQIVRFTLKDDSLVMTAEDAKRGPLRHAVPVVSSTKETLHVNMDAIFTDIIRGVDILSGKQQPGKLDASKTTVSLAKGDASHLEVSVNYHYDTKSVPLDITIRKSLLLLSEKPMKSRPIDRRLGFKSFNNKHIDRFNIDGKQIVFYVDDHFPTLWKDAIKQGIEDWNIAFERIGHPNAIKAMTYSEAGKGFDPFDITNNCFYAVESDFANAMGSHWTDPRSGEIIQADVQFYTNVIERLKSWIVMQTGAYNKEVQSGINDATISRMIRYSVAHEIGHCLGLEHNFRASYSYPTDSLRNADFCRRNGTTPSIMDYARFNYVAQRGDKVDYVFPPILGDYDKYAIEAGYADFSPSEYKAFIDKNQSNPRHLYRKATVSVLPTDETVQQADLGDNPLASTRYGVNNLKALPESALRQLKAIDLQKYYFQLLMHTVPCLDNSDVRKYVESELNEGYKFLYTGKCNKVFGDQQHSTDSLRKEFIKRVRSKYDLHLSENGASGMWFPYQAVEKDIFSLLRKDGFALSKKDIYAINKKCLSGAVLSMSSDNGLSSPFASASFVSADGLVITNWHCVSPYVQKLATKDNDYTRYGCWAQSREQEAPLFNMEMHQMLSCEDVTDKVTAGTDTIADNDKREQAIDRQARDLMAQKEPYGCFRKIYSMMGGKQFIMVRYRTFYDVRIVACPPMWLGKFGGDTDNWKWPRYSCDFALLRVYASDENKPSRYSKQNVPYHPDSWLRWSHTEVKENDFAMVMGYPSQTRKHIPALAVDKIVNTDTQLRVNFLKAKIDFLTRCRDNAPESERSAYDVRIGKFMNVYLRSRGEIDGVRNNNVVERKRREEARLQEWINASEERRKLYGEHLIADIDSVYSRLTLYNRMNEAFSQFIGSGPTVIPFAGKFEKLVAIERSKRASRNESMEEQIEELQRNIDEYFTQVKLDEDREMLSILLPIYLKAVPKKYLPAVLHKDFNVDSIFRTSILTDRERLCKMLSVSIDSGLKPLVTDPLYRMCIDIYTMRVQKQMKDETPLRRKNTRLYNTYMRAYCQMHKDEALAYDANHTLRLAPGRVQDMTQLGGMLARIDQMKGNKDYEISPSFRKLLESSNETLPVACFTTNAETSSGNSGSAVVNAKGELIGLNFDRTGDSAYSIYHADPDNLRNIVVSSDYILWVLKHYSPSKYVLDELK
ncbi:MAG: S46 family peptidase [Bacteroidaceae bacterium]|nr:S46 family peptidase [Bacteroidaceae bacterium]